MQALNVALPDPGGWGGERAGEGPRPWGLRGSSSSLCLTANDDDTLFNSGTPTSTCHHDFARQGQSPSQSQRGEGEGQWPPRQVPT